MENREQILKVLVGSRAHGLHNENSDFDYRGVFVVPTSEILKVSKGKIKNTHWVEDNNDDTSWEIGHFLHMSTKCNPTILETYLSPIIEATDEGEDMRALFDAVWNAKDVQNAFIGYGLNQRKKFLDNKDKRRDKYAAAYLRSLYNGYELLRTGTFTVLISETEIGDTVRRFKNGEYEIGEVISVCSAWEEEVRTAGSRCDKKTDVEKVDDFLLKIRKSHWNNDA